MTRIVPSIAVAVCMLYPASVRADSVTITSGSVALGSVRGNPGLIGTLNDDMFSVFFRWGGAIHVPCPSGCLVGDAVTLTTTAHAPNNLNTGGLDNDAMGVAIIGGTFYGGLAFVGDLAFVGPTFTFRRFLRSIRRPFQFPFYCRVRSCSPARFSATTCSVRNHSFVSQLTCWGLVP